MKTLIAALLSLCLAPALLAQGVSLRATNGVAYGTLTLNNQYTYAPATATVFTDTDYNGVYSFYTTTAYGNQVATNSTGKALQWDNEGLFDSVWTLRDAPNGTVNYYMIYDGTGWKDSWGNDVDGVVSGINNTVSAFRTLVTNGAVSLPDDVWQPDIVNGSGTLNLNNNYQRLTIDGASSGSFDISALANTATGRPRWTVLKIYNSSGSSCAITFSYTTRHLNTAISAIADDKVAIVSVYDDGLGNSDSIVTASKVEP